MESIFKHLQDYLQLNNKYITKDITNDDIAWVNLAMATMKLSLA
jgi:tRNA isopentenyl-2-thiomethyl-A-37 hydroxylase MiaE